MDIDGLRGVSVLLIVVFHMFPRELLPGGFVGVDVFFVISGFVVTSSMKNELGHGFSFSAFYKRRVLRISRRPRRFAHS